MKNSTLLLIGLILFACSNPNKKYEVAIKEYLKKQAMGVELKYKSMETEVTPILAIEDKKIEKQKVDSLDAIVKEWEAEFSKIEKFSLNYLTKEKLLELRNQENRLRSTTHKDYIKFVFSDDCYSDWCKTLREQITQTDSLIASYDNLGEFNTTLWRNVLWYNKREADYYKVDASGYETILQGINEYEIAKQNLSKAIEDYKPIDALPDDQIMRYKVYNKYTIINPFLNNAKQEIERIFIFSLEDEILSDEFITEVGSLLPT